MPPPRDEDVEDADPDFEVPMISETTVNAAGPTAVLATKRPWTAVAFFIDPAGDVNADGATVTVRGVLEGIESAPIFSYTLVGVQPQLVGPVVGSKAASRYIAYVQTAAAAATVRVGAIGYGREPS